MPATLRLGDSTATIANGVWASDDPILLAEVQSFDQNMIVAGADPTYDEGIARYVANEIGGEVIAATPADGLGFYPRYDG